MIVDTDVLIWYFRGNGKARKAIEKAGSFNVSAITVMELMQGAKNKAEQKAIYTQLRAWGAEIIHIDESISIRAIQYVNDFSLGYSMGVTDALIAGTAAGNDEELFTANVKHFSFVPGLALKKFEP